MAINGFQGSLTMYNDWLTSCKHTDDWVWLIADCCMCAGMAVHYWSNSRCSWIAYVAPSSSHSWEKQNSTCNKSKILLRGLSRPLCVDTSHGAVCSEEKQTESDQWRLMQRAGEWALVVISGPLQYVAAVVVHICTQIEYHTRQSNRNPHAPRGERKETCCWANAVTSIL